MANEKTLQRKQRDWQKQDNLEIDAAIEGLLQHRHGRRFLDWLLSISRAIGQTPYDRNALATAFNCGEQNIGIQLMARMMEVSPKGFTGLLEEAASERTERKRIESDLRERDERDGDGDGYDAGRDGDGYRPGSDRY